MSSFDYLPNADSYMPHSYPAPGQFQTNLQSSELLRNMFSTSGASSPSSGPYTPVSTISENYVPSDPCNADAQAQAEIVLQMEMQQEFAAYSWGNIWGSESMLLRDDFDLNSIPPIELGAPKYTENLTLAAPDTSGLEFGHEFTHALDSQLFLDESQNLGGLLGFDEIMTAHGF